MSHNSQPVCVSFPCVNWLLKLFGKMKIQTLLIRGSDFNNYQSVTSKYLFLFYQTFSYLCFSETSALFSPLSGSDHLGQGADTLGYRLANCEQAPSPPDSVIPRVSCLDILRRLTRGPGSYCCRLCNEKGLGAGGRVWGLGGSKAHTWLQSSHSPGCIVGLHPGPCHFLCTLS